MRAARTAAVAILLAATPAAAQLWEVGNRLLERPGGATSQVRYGGALAAGDVDDDGYGDLAVGLPGRHDLPANLAGAVQILYGALLADGFERGTAAGWSPL